MKSILYAAMLCLLSLSSCKKEVVDPVGGDGAKVAASSSRYIRVELDGQLWEADFVQAFAHSPGSSFATGRYQLYGELASGDYFQILLNDLTGNAITTGTYDFNAQTSDYSAASQYQLGSTTYFSALGGQAGSIVISRLDESHTEGTFSGMVVSTTGSSYDTIQVTNGVFATDNFTVL